MTTWKDGCLVSILVGYQVPLNEWVILILPLLRKEGRLKTCVDWGLWSCPEVKCERVMYLAWERSYTGTSTF